MNTSSIPPTQRAVKPPRIGASITCRACRGQDDGCTECDGSGHFISYRTGDLVWLDLAGAESLHDLVTRLGRQAERAEGQCRARRSRRRHAEADTFAVEALAFRLAAAALDEVLHREGTPPPAAPAQPVETAFQKAQRWIKRRAA